MVTKNLKELWIENENSDYPMRKSVFCRAYSVTRTQLDYAIRDGRKTLLKAKAEAKKELKAKELSFTIDEGARLAVFTLGNESVGLHASSTLLRELKKRLSPKIANKETLGLAKQLVELLSK